MKPQILHEDEHLIAVSKPAGMLTIADRAGNPALKDWLQQRFPAVYTVHRIDRDTSGLVLFARTEWAHRTLSMLFEAREVEKEYNGLVMGKPSPPEGSIQTGIMEHPVIRGKMVASAKGRPSHTDFRTIETFRMFSWMAFRIHTGRTHQIRVHMASIGHPIVCDELYGDGKPVLLSSVKRNYKLSKGELEERPILSRLALHAASLRFNLEGKDYFLEAPAPKDMRALMEQLRKS